MAKKRRHYWQYLITNDGLPIPNATVEVYEKGGLSIMNIFETETSSEPMSPIGTVTTRYDGYFDFWVQFEDTPDGAIDDYDYPMDTRGHLKWYGNTIPNGSIDDVDIMSTIIGHQGRIGDIGPQGDTGNQGVQGLQGLQGLPGKIGATGPSGLDGPRGIQGTQGVQGITGLQGEAGSNRGPQGLQGPTGNQGHDGRMGIQGPQGYQGDIGAVGDIGVQGYQGPQGYGGNSGSLLKDRMGLISFVASGPRTIWAGDTTDRSIIHSTSVPLYYGYNCIAYININFIFHRDSGGDQSQPVKFLFKYTLDGNTSNYFIYAPRANMKGPWPNNSNDASNQSMTMTYIVNMPWVAQDSLFDFSLNFLGAGAAGVASSWPTVQVNDYITTWNTQYYGMNPSTTKTSTSVNFLYF